MRRVPQAITPEWCEKLFALFSGTGDVRSPWEAAVPSLMGTKHDEEKVGGLAAPSPQHRLCPTNCKIIPL